jgi:hypothetical protein
MRCQVAHAAMMVERSITRAWVAPTERLQRSKEATMRMVRAAGGRLELHESWAFLKAACAIGSCLLPIAARVGQHGLGPMSVGRIIGIASGSVFLLLLASVLDNRLFVFDPVQKWVTWKQQNWFRSRGGQLPFGDIKDVLVTRERVGSDQATRSYDHYTAVLVTTGGSIRLTGTSSLNKREYEELANAILAILAAPDEGLSQEGEVDRLVAAGRMIDAVTLIRREQGVGLAEARKMTDDLKRRQQQRLGSG